MRVYYHTTPGYNVPSIDRQGLLLAYCQTDLQAVWLTRDRPDIGRLAMVANRHHCSSYELVVYEVRVSSAVEAHNHGRAVVVVREDIPASCLRKIA